MAANKFATMLHGNTNRMTLILIYAVLEWILILLLLMDSFFSFMIIKFADHFGLKRPCLWCSRLDHLLEPGKNKICYRDLLCEAHAIEISKLGYCLNHQKLAESQDMCHDCLSSSCLDHLKLPKNFSLLVNGKEISRCSCCGEELESRFYPPILTKHSWGILNKSQKHDLSTEEGNVEEGYHSDQGRLDYYVIDHSEDVPYTEENKGNQRDLEEPMKDESLNVTIDHQPSDQTNIQVVSTRGKTLGISPKHIEFYIDGEDCRLIPVDLIGSATIRGEDQFRHKVDDQGNGANEDVILDFDMHSETKPTIENWHTSGSTTTMALFSTQTDNCSSFTVRDEETWEMREYEQASIVEGTKTPSCGSNVEESIERIGEANTDAHQTSEEDNRDENDEFEAEISIGTEIPDQEPLEEYQSQLHDTQENPSSVLVIFKADCSHNVEADEFVEFHAMPESFDCSHKKFSFFERKESGTVEESLDGSIVREFDSEELSVENLNSALKAQRKALRALYAELEEERSASAISTNQTMAMINRLQEEKATMQMEALQYQRMMEEQCEYDQEALRLLNRLMVRCEKEKEELEKELKIYRKKVEEYEVDEKSPIIRGDDSTRSRTSSACHSNGEHSDGFSFDFGREANEEDNILAIKGSNQNTTAEAIWYSDELLQNFGEQRLSMASPSINYQVS